MNQNYTLSSCLNTKVTFLIAELCEICVNIHILPLLYEL